MTNTIRLLIAALLLLDSSRLLAFHEPANLVSNAGFDNGLEGWDVSDTSAVEWIANYDSPPPGTQSIGAAALFQTGAFTSSLSQCVGVTAAVEYKVSAWVIDACADNARLEIDWNSRPDCADGSVLGSDATSSSLASNDWQRLETKFVAPDSAKGALVSLVNTDNCTSAVLFDDVFFGDQIFSNSFE